MRAKIALAFFVAVAMQASMPDMPLIGFNDPRAMGVAVQQVAVGLAIGFALTLRPFLTPPLMPNPVPWPVFLAK